jgi:hypothetical protein
MTDSADEPLVLEQFGAASNSSVRRRRIDPIATLLSPAAKRTVAFANEANLMATPSA